MTKQKDTLSSYKGRYLRTLGKHIDSAGKLAPKKFLLGTDRAAAEIANRRLERLWQCVIERHQNKVKAASDAYEACTTIGELLDLRRELDRVTGRDADRQAVIEHGPVWLPETLAIAEAVRAGRHEVLVEPSPPGGYFDYASRLRGLERDYGSVIAFRPASTSEYDAAREHVKNMAAGLVRDCQKRSSTIDR